MADDASDPILIETGKRIRAARLAANLSLTDLARLTGISTGALSLIETGKRDSRLTTLARIAEALRLAPTTLLAASDGEEEPPTLEPPSGGYDLDGYE
ncbi:helix-turn-helix domain-containing protein [Amaricoccus macauensis]|uniref:helix-turn-helix domain-containing protein n=1 Tax=Amaricoccus macauensis TaxID=57001 RepID=UPI003C7AFDF9